MEYIHSQKNYVYLPTQNEHIHLNLLLHFPVMPLLSDFVDLRKCLHPPFGYSNNCLSWEIYVSLCIQLFNFFLRARQITLYYIALRVWEKFWNFKIRAVKTATIGIECYTALQDYCGKCNYTSCCLVYNFLYQCIGLKSKQWVSGKLEIPHDNG